MIKNVAGIRMELTENLQNSVRIVEVRVTHVHTHHFNVDG